MGGRRRNALAVATAAAMALAACGGGDEAAEDTGAQGAPATQTAEPAEAGGMEQGQQVANLPEGVTQAQVDQGRQLFRGSAICYSCHGQDAMGTQLAPNLHDEEWLNISGRNYDEIVALIKSGVPQPMEHPGPMPPMGGANLTDEQVDALAAYVVSLGS
jgi:mono/diheme cytochrome c family protein